MSAILGVLTSKTVLLNLATILIPWLLGVLKEANATEAVSALGAVNIGLRFLTKSSITEKGVAVRDRMRGKLGRFAR